MEYVYHGSKVHDLKELIPHKSTHGEYVYATSDKTIAIVMSKKYGDDSIYSFGRNNKNKPYDLVERISGAFDKMFANDFSLYYLDASEFKNIHTEFNEVVSDHSVSVLKEEKYDNVMDAINELVSNGLIKIYRYPDRPEYIPYDDSDIIEKLENYIKKLNRSIENLNIEYWIFRHPNIENELREFALKYGYEAPPYDEIKEIMIKRQEENPEKEYFIDESLYMKEIHSNKTK